jgi:hypothetical protein
LNFLSFLGGTAILVDCKLSWNHPPKKLVIISFLKKFLNVFISTKSKTFCQTILQFEYFETKSNFDIYTLNEQFDNIDLLKMLTTLTINQKELFLYKLGQDI